MYIHTLWLSLYETLCSALLANYLGISKDKKGNKIKSSGRFSLRDTCILAKMEFSIFQLK